MKRIIFIPTFSLFLFSMTGLIYHHFMGSKKYATPIETEKERSKQEQKQEEIYKPVEIIYGNEAPHTLEIYFDLNCQHCEEFYEKFFAEIKERFVFQNKLQVIFKPYPIHDETIVLMTCCQNLTNQENKLIFEMMMERSKLGELSRYELLKHCLDKLNKPFQLPTSSVLKEALTLTKKHVFEELPMMFLDTVSLSEAQQGDIINVLEEKLI